MRGASTPPRRRHAADGGSHDKHIRNDPGSSKQGGAPAQERPACRTARCCVTSCCCCCLSVRCACRAGGRFVRARPGVALVLAFVLVSAATYGLQRLERRLRLTTTCSSCSYADELHHILRQAGKQSMHQVRSFAGVDAEAAWSAALATVGNASEAQFACSASGEALFSSAASENQHVANVDDQGWLHMDCSSHSGSPVFYTVGPCDGVRHGEGGWDGLGDAPLVAADAGGARTIRLYQQYCRTCMPLCRSESSWWEAPVPLMRSEVVVALCEPAAWLPLSPMEGFSATTVLVHVARAPEWRLADAAPVALGEHPAPSILLVMLDSVSATAAKRQLGRTMDLINDLAPEAAREKKPVDATAYSFKQFNALGLRTMFNIGPLITGFYASLRQAALARPSEYKSQINEAGIAQMQRDGWVRGTGQDAAPPPPLVNGLDRSAPIDHVEFVWDRLKGDHGYVTAFAEAECVSVAGFVMQPTDYFHRREWCALDDLFGYRPSARHPRCLGSMPAHRLLMDHARGVWAQHPGRPKFGMYSFMEGHEATGTVIRTVDADLRELVRDAVAADSRGGETVVVLMGDHGLRFSLEAELALSGGDSGRYEAIERDVMLPLLSVVVPDSLLHRHPQLGSALESNRDVLTTAYDVWATIRHLPTYPGDEPEDVVDARCEFEESVHPNMTASQGTPSSAPWRKQPKTPGRSLLTPLPRTRGCKEAGVPSAACTHTVWRESADDAERSAAAGAAATGVSLLAAAGPKSCEAARVTRVLSARRQYVRADAAKAGVELDESKVYVRVAFEAQYGVVYEAGMAREPLSAREFPHHVTTPFGVDNATLAYGGSWWTFGHLARATPLTQCACPGMTPSDSDAFEFCLCQRCPAEGFGAASQGLRG